MDKTDIGAGMKPDGRDPARAHDGRRMGEAKKMARVTMMFMAGLILLGAASLLAIPTGAQQAAVTDDNLGRMAANAKTPADHEAIADYYDKEAAANEKKAELHRASENIYTKTANLAHCRALVRSYLRAADEDKALAAGHRAMAGKLKAQTGR